MRVSMSQLVGSPGFRRFSHLFALVAAPVRVCSLVVGWLQGQSLVNSNRQDRMLSLPYFHTSLASISIYSSVLLHLWHANYHCVHSTDTWPVAAKFQYMLFVTLSHCWERRISPYHLFLPLPPPPLALPHQSVRVLATNRPLAFFS